MAAAKLQLLSAGDEDTLSWTVLGPKQLSKLPRNRRMTFHLKFVVKNKTTESKRIKVQLESPSPILLFRKKQRKRMSRTRLYAKITTLGHAIDHTIPPEKEVTFDFPSDYAPHTKSPLPSKLRLIYGIFVYNEDNELQDRFGPRNLILRITEQASPSTPINDHIL